MFVGIYLTKTNHGVISGDGVVAFQRGQLGPGTQHSQKQAADTLDEHAPRLRINGFKLRGVTDHRVLEGLLDQIIRLSS